MKRPRREGGAALRAGPPHARATRARAPPFPLTAPGLAGRARGGRVRGAARGRGGGGRRGPCRARAPPRPPAPAGPARAAPPEPGLRNSGKEAAAAPVSAERRRAQPGPDPRPPAGGSPAAAQAPAGPVSRAPAAAPRGRGKPRARPLLTASPRGAALSPAAVTPPRARLGYPAPQGLPAAPSGRPARPRCQPRCGDPAGPAGSERSGRRSRLGEAQVGPRWDRSLHAAGCERDGGCVWSSLRRSAECPRSAAFQLAFGGFGSTFVCILGSCFSGARFFCRFRAERASEFQFCACCLPSCASSLF